MLYKLLLIILKPIAHLFYGLDQKNLPILQEDQPAMILSNHASFLDPVFISLVFPRPIQWVAKKELFENKFFGSFLKKLGAIPINRDKGDVGSLKAMMKVAKSGGVIGIFPEGTRMKTIDFSKAKPQTLTLASQLKVPVVPVSIQGNYRMFSKTTIVFHKPLYFQNKIQGQEARTAMDHIMGMIYDDVFPNLDKIYGQQKMQQEKDDKNKEEIWKS